MNDQEYNFTIYYLEQYWEEMRHIEQLRFNISSLIVTLAALISGFAVQQEFNDETIIMSIFIITLGLFGAIMVRKLYQLHQSDQEKLDKWHAYLDSKIPNSQVISLRDTANIEHKRKFPILSKIPHNYFWFTLHLFISFTGIIILIITLSK